MKTFIRALTTLQDARYCAAMGIHYVGFSLERGSTRKLPVNLIWNLAQWITGPEIVLHLNADSLEELEEARKSIAIAAITLPLADAAAALSVAPPDQIILRCHSSQMAEALELLANHPTLRLEITVDKTTALPAVLPAPNAVVHFPTRETLMAFLTGKNSLGHSVVLGAEVLDANGELDYAFLDELEALLPGVK